MRGVRVQAEDQIYQDRVRHLLAEGEEGYPISSEGGLRLNGRLIVSEDEELRHVVMTESHGSRFAIHPRGIKCTRI